MQSRLKQIIASFVAISSIAALADTYTWKNTGTAGMFYDSGNWTLTSTGEDATVPPGENLDGWVVR